MRDEFRDTLALRAAEPYRRAGRFAYGFARGKLAGDPVFAAILRYGLLPEGARILDLGCGQGLLAAWLRAARQSHAAGDWPAAWPPAPRIMTYTGIDLGPREVAWARIALGATAELRVGDVRFEPFPPADAVIVLDLLHYLEPPAQVELLRRVRARLEPGGLLLLRIGDAAAGWRQRYSNAVDRVIAALRGRGLCRLYDRPRADWEALLNALGYRFETVPLRASRAFAHCLFRAWPEPAAVTARGAGPGSPA